MVVDYQTLHNDEFDYVRQRGYVLPRFVCLFVCRLLACPQRDGSRIILRCRGNVIGARVQM